LDKVTLYEVRVTRTASHGIVELSAAMAIFGVHLRSETPTFAQYDVELSNLSEWTGFRPILPLPHTELYDRGVGYKSPQSLTAECGVGVVELYGSAGSTVGARRVSIEHRDALSLRPAIRLSVDDVEYRMVRPLCNFLALATGSFPDVVRLQALHGSRSGSTPRQLVCIHRRSRVPRGERIYNHEIPLPLDQIDFAATLPVWFRVFQELATPCDLLFDCTAGFITNRFFDVASAVEGMHQALIGGKSRATPEEKRRIKEVVQHLPEEADREWVRSRLGQLFGPNFETRLRELRELVGDCGYLYTEGGGLGGLEAWSKLAAEYRNRIAHSRDIEGINLAHLIHLEWSISGLLRLVLLRQLGFDNDEAHRIAMIHMRRFGQ
jgi:hypothetical protein